MRVDRQAETLIPGGIPRFTPEGRALGVGHPAIRCQKHPRVDASLVRQAPAVVPELIKQLHDEAHVAGGAGVVGVQSHGGRDKKLACRVMGHTAIRRYSIFID